MCNEHKQEAEPDTVSSWEINSGFKLLWATQSPLRRKYCPSWLIVLLEFGALKRALGDLPAEAQEPTNVCKGRNTMTEVSIFPGRAKCSQCTVAGVDTCWAPVPVEQLHSTHVWYIHT